MDTHRHEIVKLPEKSVAPASSFRSVLINTRTIFKLIIIFIKIPKGAAVTIMGGLIAIVVFVLLFSRETIPNELNQSKYQLTSFSANIELTANYQHQAILSDYLKNMTQIILEDSPKKIKGNLAIFRAMTQATLQELDPGRKRYVIMLLHDANLLQISPKQQPSLLAGANLSGVNLQGMNLKSANLQGTNLAKVDFRGADLRAASLENANLTDSCYNDTTVFDKNFQPNLLRMRKIKHYNKCN